jgi:hypothetical protein
MSRLTIIVFVTALAAGWIGCTSSDSSLADRLQTPTSVSVTSTPSKSSTSLPDTPPADCLHTPLGGFNDVWRNEQVWPRLGCAVAPAEAITGTEAYLCCVHSIWVQKKHLFVTVDDSGLRWSFVVDESGVPLDAPLMVAPIPRPQPCFPATGRHGWLARSPSWAERCEGTSSTAETRFSGAMQQFEGGWLLWNGNVCFVLFIDDGTWTMF